MAGRESRTPIVWAALVCAVASLLIQSTVVEAATRTAYIQSGVNDVESSCSSGNNHWTDSPDLDIHDFPYVAWRYSSIGSITGQIYSIRPHYWRYGGYNSQSGNLYLDFAFERSSNPGSFSQCSDVATRCSNVVSVRVDDWYISRDYEYTGPELVDSFDALVDEVGWDGNSLVVCGFDATGSGSRQIESYDAYTTQYMTIYYYVENPTAFYDIDPAQGIANVPSGTIRLYISNSYDQDFRNQYVGIVSSALDCSNSANFEDTDSLTDESNSGYFRVEFSALPAGTYKICTTLDYDDVWYEQTEISYEVIEAQPDDVTSFYPRNVGVGTRPFFTALGVPTSTATVKLGLSPGTACASMDYEVDNPGDNFQFPTAFTTANTLSICLSLDNGVTYVRQVVAEIAVFGTSDLIAVEPNVMGVGTRPVLDFQFAKIVDTGSVVAFVPSAQDCSYVPKEAVTVLTTLGTAHTTIGASIGTAGTYDVCYSVDNGATYSDTSVTIEVLEATTASATDVNPAEIVVGSAPFVFADVSPSSVTQISLPAGAAACGENVYVYDAHGTESPVLATANIYKICVSYDSGNNWAEQLGLTITVFDPQASDVGVAAAPSIFVNGVVDSITFSGTTSERGLVGFAPTTLCGSSVVRQGDNAINAGMGPFSVTLSVTTIAPSLTLHLCLSRDDGVTWVEQDAVVTVAVESEYSVTAVSPEVILTDAAIQLTFEGAIPSPGTYVGLVERGQTCDSPSVPTAMPSTNVVVMAGTVMSETVFDVCYSLTGGTSYTKQIIPSVASISDVNAAIIGTVSPNVIGLARNTQITLTSSSNGRVAFALPGACSTSGERFPSAGIAFTSGVSFAAPTISTGGVYSVCFSDDAGVTFTAQVQFGVELDVVDGAEVTVTAANPSAVPHGTTPTITFTGATSTPDARVALLTGADCDSGRDFVTDLDDLLNDGQAVFTGPLSTGGLLPVCYTADNTNWYLQPAQLHVVQALATSITSVSRNTVGEASRATITFAGVVDTGVSAVALALTGNCDGPRYSETPASAAFVLSDATPANAPGVSYAVCYTTNGVLWTEQTTVGVSVRVVPATSTTITAVSPDKIGTRTKPEMTFTGGEVTGTTYIAFSLTAGGCTSAMTRLGLTAYSDPSGIFPLGAFITGLSTQTYQICLTVNLGAPSETWVAQVGPQLEVHAGSATSLSAIVPSAISTQIPAVLQVSMPEILPEAHVGFALDASGCTNTLLRWSETAFANTDTFVLSEPLVQQNTYSVCYSVDGSTWHAQDNIVLNVYSAVPLAVVSVTPQYVAVGTQPDIRLDGIVATPTTQVGFSTSGCGGGLDGLTDYNVASAPLTGVVTLGAPIASPGAYLVCYSTSGSNFVQQTRGNVVLHVVDAVPGSVSGIEPGYVGVGADVVVTLAGVNPTPTSRIAFSTVDCTLAGQRVAETVFNDTVSVALTAQFEMAGTHTLCYSVNGVDFIPQDNGSIEVVDASPTDIETFAPGFIGVNGIPTLSMTTAAGVELTPSAAVGFDSTPSMPCTSLINIEGRTSVGTPGSSSAFASVPLAIPISAPGNFTVCYSVNGNAFVAQAMKVTVVEATPTSITSLTPPIIQNNQRATFNITGGPPLETALVALAPVGLCGIGSERQGVTPFTVAGVPLATDSEISVELSYVNMSACYSVDDGATWAEQTNTLVGVVSECDALYDCGACNLASFCTWCLTENTCRGSFNETACPSQYWVAPDDQCPRIQGVDRLWGSDAGYSNVTINATSSYFIDSDELLCRWWFSSDTIRFTPTVIESPTQLSCLSPPQPPGFPFALLAIDYRNVLYSGDETLIFVYYDCVADSTCSNCYDPSVKPECGTCFATGACQTERECSSLWGGDQCSTIADLSPRSVNYREGGLLTVSGQLFINSTSLSCAFVFEDLEAETPATWVSGDELTCAIPAETFPADAIADVVIMYNGAPYTNNVYTFVFAGDEAVTVEDSGSSLIIAILMALLLIALIIFLVIFCAWRAQKRKREQYMPPKLTEASLRKVIFGTTPKEWPQYPADPSIYKALADLIMVNDRFLLFTITDITQATEADAVAKSLVYVAESYKETIGVIRDFITREVDESISQSTLFRANSFATKLFKTYSRMLGTPYLHSALGYVLNQQLAKIGDQQNLTVERATVIGAGAEMHDMGRDPDQEDAKAAEQSLSKFILLTLCQKVFNAIIKSESEVPNAFRDIFRHVQISMREKYPVRVDDLAHIINDQLMYHLSETQFAYTEGQISFAEVERIQYQLSEARDVQALGDLLDPMHARIEAFKANITSLASTVDKMLETTDNIEGALDPDSSAARRILAEHNEKQNSIAVGGFFFLRFLVPAVTAPEAFQLVKSPPTQQQRRLLVLVGKVIQNLSNNRTFGQKEKNMESLNDFVTQNRKRIHKLFDRLSSVPDDWEDDYVPVVVPQKHLESAYKTLYNHVLMNMDKILGGFDRACADLNADRASVLRIMQTRELLCSIMAQIEQAEKAAGGGGARFTRRGTSANAVGGLNTFSSVTSDQFASFNAAMAAAAAGGSAAGVGDGDGTLQSGSDFDSDSARRRGMGAASDADSNRSIFESFNASQGGAPLMMHLDEAASRRSVMIGNNFSFEDAYGPRDGASMASSGETLSENPVFGNQ